MNFTKIHHSTIYQCLSFPCPGYLVEFQPRKYQFDLWGASGYDIDSIYSRGGHVSGIIEFGEKQNLYLYIGEEGQNHGSQTYNGGGSGGIYSGYSGGGSTDIRIMNGDYSNFESLLSRIIVSGGGGGFSINDEFTISRILFPGGYSSGGGLEGCSGDIKRSDYSNLISNAGGGSQTTGDIKFNFYFSLRGKELRLLSNSLIN
jgi:hypothetical protein